MLLTSIALSIIVSFMPVSADTVFDRSQCPDSGEAYRKMRSDIDQCQQSNRCAQDSDCAVVSSECGGQIAIHSNCQDAQQVYAKCMMPIVNCSAPANTQPIQAVCKAGICEAQNTQAGSAE